MKTCLLLMISKSDFPLQLLYWQCHICNFLSTFSLERHFLPEAKAFEDCSLWLSWGVLSSPCHPVPGPYFFLSHQAWPRERSRDARWPWSPGWSGNEQCLVEDFSLKAIMRQDAQDCPPEEALIRGWADGEIMLSLPAQPAALRPPGARAVTP